MGDFRSVGKDDGVVKSPLEEAGCWMRFARETNVDLVWDDCE